MNWHNYFPMEVHPEIRPEQAQILDFIVSCIQQGKQDILIEAPAGVGKSAIAFTLTDMFGGCISTTTIALEDQYMGDFGSHGLRQLHNKSHYTCEYKEKLKLKSKGKLRAKARGVARNCDIGHIKDCPLIRTRKEIRANPSCLECPYQIARHLFDCSQSKIANIAFMLNYVKSLRRRKQPIAIFDEGHLLGENIVNQYTVEMQKLPDLELQLNEDEVFDWCASTAFPYYELALAQARYELTVYEEGEPDFVKLYKQEKRLAKIVQTLEAVISGGEEYWIPKLEVSKLTIEPKWPHIVSRTFLDKIANFRIYISATLTAHERQASWLGVSEQSPFLRLDSPFPVEHRRVYILPLIRWNYSLDGFESAYEIVGKAVDQILAEYPDKRGLIHCSSFRQVEAIMEGSQNGARLIRHDKGSKAKNEALAKLKKMPGGVLVSPSCHEGVDLKDDACRFIIIVKLPRPTWGDKSVQLRSQDDPSWLEILVAQKIVQASGRGVRHMQDYCDTYIIDAGFKPFCNKRIGMRLNKALLPRWFRKAFVWL